MCLAVYHAMKTYGGIAPHILNLRTQLHALAALPPVKVAFETYGGSRSIVLPFLTSALHGVEWSASGPSRIASGDSSHEDVWGERRYSSTVLDLSTTWR
jgi:hypothetical protein